MATAEAAVAVVSLVVVLALLLQVVIVVAARLRAGDAARLAARSLARGDGLDAATALARRALPGADVRVSVDDGLLVVRVGVEVELPALHRTHHISARAVAEPEPPGLP